MRINRINKFVIAALLLAIGLVLPFFIMQIPAIGKMLLPMHLPVLICGFVCGGFYGMVVGIVLPLLRSVLFGMPALMPDAVCMVFELAAYGFVSGVLYQKLSGKKGAIYGSLITAMAAGRIVWGLAAWAVYTILGNSFTWEFYAMAAFVNALPGIILQLIAVPAIVAALRHAGFSHCVSKHKELDMKAKCAHRFEPVVAAIDRLLKESDKKTILVAIDGKCAGGKTTLGHYLQKLYDCNVFHMDDFFLRPEQRTEERMQEIGGNVDYERFRDEVLDEIRTGQTVTYRKFDCQAMALEQTTRSMEPKRLNIIEGSYSMHPHFENVYDLKFFLNLNDEQQLENIRKRNGEEKLQRFKNEWIPKENAYFEQFHIRQQCVVIEWNG